ncbi:MAG: ABC transporter substrate-binding protein [Burkholderiales bacterium]|jgi:branched-chain amino acid transport system substrate-binding protein|nr:ABC transporter substrate-binding protein [Burkholderiales bacterium]
MIQVSRWCHVKNKKLLARAFFGSLTACAAFTLSGIATAEIVIGRTLPLTGAFATYGIAKRDGADALIARINREGGVNGQLLRVETLDDTYLPAKTVANLKQLADQQRPVAFLGLFGVPTIAAAIPVITELKVPTVGLTSGTAALRANYNPYIFPVRASYAEEAKSIVTHLKLIGLTQVAIIQQDLPFGQATRDTFVAALTAAGITTFTEHKVSASGDTAAAAVEQMKKTNPQAVFLAMLSNAAVPVLKEMSKQVRGVSSYAFSPIDTTLVMKQTEGAAKGLGVTQIVPIPTGASMLVVRDYLRDLEALKRGEPSFYSLEAYLEAAVLVEGIKRSGSASPSAAALIRALETMNPYDNRGFTVRYNNRSHEGSRYVDLTVIGRNGVMH